MRYDVRDIVGAKLGNASAAGSWHLSYAYQDLETDAVLGLLSNSNFAGGGTDGKGYRVVGTYAINKQWNVVFTWYVDNEAGRQILATQSHMIVSFSTPTSNTDVLCKKRVS